MSQTDEEAIIPVTEQRSIHWHSKINICPASSSTLPSVLISEEENKTENEDTENTEEEEGEQENEERAEELINSDSDSSWPDVDIPGTWGTQALENTPWSDDQKPYVKITRYQDLILNEDESKGILTDRIIAACSSYLDRSPVTGKYVLCKVELSKKSLTDISIMSYHHYLQYVDLSWNELNDVEVLGQLPFLMCLNLSHNLLTKVLDFKPPFYLTYVNYSYNLITEIDDLTEFWSIVSLNLSHNNISRIEGLSKLKYLRHLDLSYNLIECIENLSHMRLQTLNLKQNKIYTFEEGKNVGLNTLNDLTYINVSTNNLKTLKLFAEVPSLQVLDVSVNNIDDLMELHHLRGLIYLIEADFRDNPIEAMKYYMEACVNMIKHLYVLDGEILSASRKVGLTRSFEPSPWCEMARKSAKIISLEQIRDPIIGAPVVPADQSAPPIIILVGPPGCSKGSLIQSFCKKHERYAIVGVSHTTRNKTSRDSDGETYRFVDSTQFRRLKRSGEFLEVSQFFGHWFGLSEQEIAKVTTKCAVLVTHMDLTGALMLRARGYKCHLVLAMPSTPEIHKKMFSEKYYNWKYGTNCLAVMEVENNPTRATEFLKENKVFLESSITSVAKKILDSIIDENIDKFVCDPENVDTDYDGAQTIQSLVFQRSHRGSSRTSGILKGAFSRSKSASEVPRVSVTFQSKECLPHSEQSIVPVPANRSVTFSNVVYSEVTDNDQSPKYSISETIMLTQPVDQYNDNGNTGETVLTSASAGTAADDDDGDSDDGLLSVLSEPMADTEIKEKKVYNFNTRHLQRKALKSLLKTLIQTRETYLEFHHSNPGIFCEVIFTDFPGEASEKLKILLRNCIKKQPTVKEHFKYNKKDTVYQTMVASRLQSLHNDIKSHLLAAQNQLGEVHEKVDLKSMPSNSQNATELVRILTSKRQHSLAYPLPKDTYETGHFLLKSRDEEQVDEADDNEI